MDNKASLYTAASVMTLSCMLFGCNLFGATTLDSPAGGITVHVEHTSDGPSMTQSKENVAEIINTQPDLSILARAIKAADLESTLQNGTFTIFAPDNAAFQKLPPERFKICSNLKIKISFATFCLRMLYRKTLRLKI